MFLLDDVETLNILGPYCSFQKNWLVVFLFALFLPSVSVLLANLLFFFLYLQNVLSVCLFLFVCLPCNEYTSGFYTGSVTISISISRSISRVDDALYVPMCDVMPSNDRVREKCLKVTNLGNWRNRCLPQPHRDTPSHRTVDSVVEFRFDYINHMSNTYPGDKIRPMI